MYQCCIFDLDGTLINSVYALTKTINLTLQEFGYPPIGDAQTKLFVGDGYKKFVERALVYSGDKELKNLEQALAIYDDFFGKNCLYRIDAYDGIRELLCVLKEKGIKIAVLSNKAHDRAVENIETVFGKGYFDVIAGEKEGVNRKPDPAGVYLVLEELGMNIKQGLYLGDTSTDMKTGIAAGMDTVGVTWGFRGREELEEYHPKYIVDDPREVIEIID